MVVKSDEDVDGYGDGDRGDSPSRYSRHPLPLQPLPPYYLILTASYSHNAQHHHVPNAQHHHVHNASYNASYNAHDNHLSDNALHYAHDNAHDNVHNDADKHGLNHAQAATALSPL